MLRRLRTLPGWVIVLATTAIAIMGCSRAPTAETREKVASQEQASSLGGGPADAGGGVCRSAQLTASRTYSPSKWTDDVRAFSPSVRFVIPSHIQLIAGNSGNHWTYLEYSLRSRKSVKCSYRGGSSKAHPSTPSELAAAQQYVFERCEGDVDKGDTVEADWISLHVHNGDNWSPTKADAVTTIRLGLAEVAPCQGAPPPDAGVDAGSDGGRTDAGDAGPTCTPASCADTNPCTADTCASNGQCVHTPVANGTACSDGNACSTGDVCTAGACGGTAVTCAASDQCHAAGTCDPATGACSNPVVADGTSCSDGSLCTTGDVCTAGACGGTAVTCAASDQCHTAGTCNPATGACSNPAVANGTACDDGSACSKNDVCTSGACHGVAYTCAPGECQASAICDGAGGCSVTNQADGATCATDNVACTADVCQSGSCAHPLQAGSCRIGNTCVAEGSHNPANPCQSCNPAVSTSTWSTSANGTSCSDGSLCTTGDVCTAGACGGTAVTCAASDQCHAAGTCNPTTGACSNPAVANGTACSDGDACSTGDTCTAGMCGGTAVTCAATDPCHAAGTCDPATGACSNPAVPNGTVCDDGTACSTGDVCTAGTCGGTAVTCAASDQCHAAGSCNPVTGACSNPTLPNGTACSDGDACSTGDTCTAGTCGGTAVTCAATDPCHAAGTCDPGTGACSNPPLPNGTACDDSTACSTGDVCTAGTCGGAAVTCAALDVCHTAGTCDLATGACSNPRRPECPIGLPPDPRVVAPALDRTVATTIYEQTKFIYAGEIPIQTGVTTGAIEVVRAAELSGRVITEVGAALSGVEITVLGHPELGHTFSRLDGRFDLVVNGGGALTVAFGKSGYLPAQRSVDVPWQRFVTLGDVILVPSDGAVTAVPLASTDYGVARGSVVTDADGTRQGTVVIAPGTQAVARLPNGDTMPLDTLSLRITEYTVGPDGVHRMPGTLPPTTAYTYAFEIDADEAIAVGANTIELNQPAPYYVDNFLRFPVGTSVPVGSYDRDCGRWDGTENGKVIKILAATGGLANIDADGDDLADGPAALATLSFTDGERQKLAELYTPGTTLWRALLPHFSPYDFNWGFFPPVDATLTTASGAITDISAECHTPAGNVNIDALSQTVAKTEPIAGTPYSLVYQSDRVEGRSAGHAVTIPLSGATIPDSLRSIELEVIVAGRTTSESFPAAPNLSYDFVWDGRDVFGRQLQGAQPIQVRIGFTYDGTYARVSQFAFPAATPVPVTGDPTRQQVTLWRESVLKPAQFDEKPFGLGGWNVDVHHAYDPSGVLFLGDGSVRKVEALGPVISTYAGGGTTTPATGVEALKARIRPYAFTVAPDGSIYYIDQEAAKIFRISPTGVLVHVAGTGTLGYNGDEQPATQAQIHPFLGRIVMATDCDAPVSPCASGGGFYYIDGGNYRIRHVDAHGIIHTVAGTGVRGITQDGVHANQATFLDMFALAIGKDGALYFDINSNRIARLGTDGVIRVIAGADCAPGTYCVDLDGVPALQTSMRPTALEVAPDGTLYVLDSGNSTTFPNRLRRIGTDGLLVTVAGGGSLPATDGAVATAVKIGTGTPDGLALDNEGNVYFTESTLKIWALATNGTLRHVAGTGALNATSPDGTPAKAANVQPTYVAMAKDGTLVFSDNGRYRRIAPVLPGLGPSSFLIASHNGRELYVFDGAGRHVRTMDTLAAVNRFVFGYDAAGRLASISDVNGNVTAIQHTSAGAPTAIVAPFGQTTALTTDADGFLASITGPAGDAVRLTYHADKPGLLASSADGVGNAQVFAYDALGRLVREADGAGGSLAFAKSIVNGTHAVTKTTGLGVSSGWALTEPAPGEAIRVSTLASGLQASQRVTANGVVSTTLPSGTVTAIAKRPDTRFGMQSPVDAFISVRTPSGGTYVQTASRTVLLNDTANLLSTSFINDTTTVSPTSGFEYISSYDGLTKTLTLESPLRRRRLIVLDSLGRTSMTAEANFRRMDFAYDARGRVASIVQGTRTRTFGYDGTTGTLRTVTDPASIVTTYARDAAGRVTAETFHNGQTARYAYANGQLASVTPPGRPAHLFTHTALGKLSQYIAPSVDGADPSTTAWAYDADGRLLGELLPDGSTVMLGYDAGARLNEISSSSGTIALGYDATSGKLATAAGPGATSMAFVYDGHLPREVTWSGDVTGKVSWGYDAYFKVVSESVNGGNVASFAYDSDGLITKAGRLALTRNGINGRVTSTSLGLVTDSSSYDQFGAREIYSASFNGSLLLSTYTTRDPVGRIWTRSESVRGGNDVTLNYIHDGRGRLAQIYNVSTLAAQFAYDANGNRTSSTIGSTVTTATYDAQDRLKTFGSLAYAYDMNGQLARKTDSATAQVTQYDYDAVGNLRRVDLPDGRVIDYLVDAAGRRIAKKIGGAVVQKWIYRDATRPAAELDAAGNVVSRFVYADDAIDNGSPASRLLERVGMARPPRVASTDAVRPSYVVRGTRVMRILTDHLGSPRFVVDVDTGEVVQEVTYDVFGAPTLVRGSYVVPFGFAGGMYDADTGLVRFGARDYDPKVGRWTAQEPTRTAGVLNAYEYAGGDPVNNVDLDGLARVESAEQQAVLDSICGPNAVGELFCTETEFTTTTEATVAQAGSSFVIDTDRTAIVGGGTDLPELRVPGDGTTGTGTTIGTGSGDATPNVAPSVSAGSNLTVSMPADNVPVTGAVADDGKPVGYPLQMLWYTRSGPEDAVFANPNVASTTVSFPRGGVYVLALAAGDAEYVTTSTITVTVNAANEPPVVTASGPSQVDLAGIAHLVGSVTDDGLPIGSTLTTTWTVVSGPGGVTFADASSPTTDATFGTTGSYVLELVASDGAFTTKKRVSINVIRVNHAPVVTAGLDQALDAETHATTLIASATDDGLPQGVLTFDWAQVSGPSAATIATSRVATTNVTFAYPGTYVFHVTASDGEQSAVDDVVVTVAEPSGGTPAVAIAGLDDDGVVTRPTEVRGTISEGAWALEYRLGGRDDVETTWSVIASGTGAANNAVLGTFDPTVLVNGMYTVRLSSKTSAGEESTSVAVAVDGRMKIGNFSLSFMDLEVPVAGLPIQVIRTYDSRARHGQDFGNGWKLSIRDIRVEKSGKPGAYWRQTVDSSGFLPVYCLAPSRAATVTVTMPTGRVYRFRPQSNPPCQSPFPIDAPDVTWENISEANNPTVKLTANLGSSVFVTGGVTGAVQLTTGSGAVWDPRQFALTTEDGAIYDVDQDKGLVLRTDRNGNTLRVTPDGIIHSSGKSITFDRDAKQRITKITDPMGKELTYAYDGRGDLVSQVDRVGAETSFTYEGAAYLKDIVDPLGRRAIRSEYDAAGRIVSQTDALGHAVAFAHDLGLNMERVTDRLGYVTVYEYNSMGDVVRKTDATGAVWAESVDTRGNTLSKTDPLGNVTQYTYDAADNQLTMVDALGHVTTNTYDAYRHLLTTTDPLGHTTRSDYDVRGNLILSTDALGHTTSYTNDRQGSPLTMTDALGHTTRYAYDEAGHLIQQIDPLGHATRYEYDAAGKKTAETTTRTVAGGTETLVSRYAYDANGRAVTTTAADGSSRTTAYTLTGKMAASVDELGRRTTSAYDAADRLVSTTRPDGAVTSNSYDLENRRVASTDAAGFTTRYAYDGVGRLTQTIFADGNTSATAYNAAGWATGQTDELGQTTSTAYDAAGRTVSTTDALGNTTSTAYDAAGNMVTSTDTLGRVTVQAYDALNRRTRTTYADGASEQMGYDASGRMTARVDALNRTTLFGYNALGRLTSVTDALAQVTRYAYDELENRVSQTDANGHATRFAYDARGRQTARTLPDGATETMTFNAAGEKTARIDFAGRLTAYAYDAAGRLTSRAYADGSRVAFTYTADGKRAGVVDGRGTTSYAYDARRRLVQTTTPEGRALAYAYDAAGRRTGLTATLGSTSLTTTTAYDAAGRPTLVTDPMGRGYVVSYDAEGRRTRLASPNSTETSYGYDTRNRVVTIVTTQSGPTPVTVQSHAYTLDVAGRRTRIVEADGTERRYGYDGIDRLTSETVTGALNYAKEFAYDAVGNRASQTTTGAGTVSYAYDARDRLVSETAATYEYDANGNTLTKSGEATYAWDFENRLTSVAMSDGRVVSHVYDADGNRVKTGSTGYLVDAGGGLSQVVTETDASGALTALYVRLGDELLSVMRPDGHGGYATRWVHHDGIGSVRGLTDESGVTTDSRAYEAFGTRNATAGSDPLAYGFAGEPLDGVSGLAYHRARWMDARVGRFHGMDPFPGNGEDPLSLHKYMYAASDSTNRIDPSGLLSPPELILGRAVHAEVGRDFKLQTGGISDTSVQGLLGWAFARGVNPEVRAFFGIGLLGRPDLSHIGNRYIFEIKPVGLAALGAIEADVYLSVLNALDYPNTWRPGTDSDYNPKSPITVLGQEVEVWVESPGVVTYYVVPTTAIRRASGIIALGSAIGVAILVGQTAIASTASAY